MAKPDKEKCSKCGSTDISIALGKDGKPDPNGKRYCQKCQHVWVNGLEGLKRPDVVLHQAQKELTELRSALDVERKKVKALEAEVRSLKGEPEPTEDEIFS